MREHVWNLRSRRSYLRILRSIANCRMRRGLRVIELSVQGNHIHLILEADDNLALSRGIQGIAIRIARALNKMMDASGKVFADHYHSHLLRNPTELVRAIAYVLENARKHYGFEGADPYSSPALGGEARAAVLIGPRGWLLRVGRYLPQVVKRAGG